MNFRRLLLIFISITLFTAGFVASLEHYTSRSAFCGTCHIMVKYHRSWAGSSHSNIDWVSCHSSPGAANLVKAKLKGLSQLFSYMATGGKGIVRAKSGVDDKSCLVANCHPEDSFIKKRLFIKGKTPFVHKPHFEKPIPGQKLHCDSCHAYVSSAKHFETELNTCYLCHFKNTSFNEGRGECELCHTLPDKPLAHLANHGSEEEPKGRLITHKRLKQMKVNCANCHDDLVEGDGNVVEDRCLDCHEKGDHLAKIDDMPLMHSVHVATLDTACRACHSRIEHKVSSDYLDRMRAKCELCHPDHHLEFMSQFTSDNREGPMNIFRTNCMACHVDDGHDSKGGKLKKGSFRACMQCHMASHGGEEEKPQNNQLK